MERDPSLSPWSWSSWYPWSLVWDRSEVEVALSSEVGAFESAEEAVALTVDVDGVEASSICWGEDASSKAVLSTAARSSVVETAPVEKLVMPSSWEGVDEVVDWLVAV